MLAFARLVAAARPDIVQINCTTPWTCKHETLIAALTPGVRTVLIEHLPVEPDGPWIRFVKRTLVRGVDAHVSVGVAAARQVERQIGLASGSLRVIESAVPEFSAQRPNGNRPRPLVGTTARLVDQKGLDVLLRALPAVPGTDVEIVGDGPERAALEALAGELGISARVRFVGWSDRAREWLGRWDVFVLPSRFEGLPLSILEAMLAELPVVATDVGSTREAVRDQVTGRLVAAGDPDALAEALRDVLSDPQRARALGLAGRELALERFTAGAQARRYEALYDELLA